MQVRTRGLGGLVGLIALGAALAGCTTPPAVERAGEQPTEIGSLRHARVATPPGDGELLYLAGSIDDEDLAALRDETPRLRIVTGLSAGEALAIAPQLHGIDGRYCTPELLAAATNLCWVQSTSAGVERYLVMPGIVDEPRIVLTNMQAVHGPTIADHAFAMLLALTRNLPYYIDAAHRGEWSRQGSGGAGGSGAEPISLQGRTLLVVGLGGIGTEVARRGKGFGMRVWATRRSDVPPPDFVDRQARPGDLLALLTESDVVVLCVPLTAETTGLIGVRELDAIKPGAYLVNIARGQVVDTDALVSALSDGRLAGAGLDVTDPEPLPADHPLWSMPNVIITPHVAARSGLTRERWRAVYHENLRRFGAGEPLLNVVDKQAGY